MTDMDILPTGEIQLRPKRPVPLVCSKAMMAVPLEAPADISCLASNMVEGTTECSINFWPIKLLFKPSSMASRENSSCMGAPR
jgi:hypothetical protein